MFFITLQTNLILESIRKFTEKFPIIVQNANLLIKIAHFQSESTCLSFKKIIIDDI